MLPPVKRRAFSLSLVPEERMVSVLSVEEFAQSIHQQATNRREQTVETWVQS
jgi:hypothetical protein